LNELARLKPFNKENLLQHILRHKSEWGALATETGATLGFRDLPNKGMLSFAFFKDADPQRLARLEKLAAKEEHERAPSSRPLADTLSEGRANTRGGSSLKHTESEILNDAGIWHVSDSDDESDTPHHQGDFNDGFGPANSAD
jgi:hypothetical protein